MRTGRREFIRHTAATIGAAAAWRVTPFAQQPQRIIVAGAGLAGLCAAFELINAGHDVVVLEARSRPGGRVFTLREPFSQGFYAEAGAQTIRSSHTHTMSYAKQFGLPLVPVKNAAGLSVSIIDGRRTIGARPAPAPDRWREMIATASPIDAPKWPPDHLRSLDTKTLAAFWRELGASDAQLLQLRQGYLQFLGDGIDVVSALDAVREAASRPSGDQSFHIDGGNDALPKAFAARLGNRIQFNAPIVAIHHDANRVRVTVRSAAGTREITGDRLVCALPFQTLRDIAIEPAFTPMKMRAIREQPSTAVTRTFLQARARYWSKEGLSGYASTDRSLFIDEITGTQPGPGALLEVYSAGARARDMSALSADRRLASTLEIVGQALGNPGDDFAANVSVMWHEDPWAKGAYAWFAPGQMTELMPHVAKAEGRVHFAGDHTSAMPGWMQGALGSAKRVVAEIGELKGD